MRALHLFAGAGGSHLAGLLLGWEDAGSVEIDPWRRSVLLERFANAPAHTDVSTFDGTPLRGAVDLLVGGSPCQDFSNAGKREGMRGAKSSLLNQQLRILEETEAPLMLWENVPGCLTSSPKVPKGQPKRPKGEDFRAFLLALDRLGYDAEWITLAASAVGASHQRKRVWLLAARRPVGGHDHALWLLEPYTYNLLIAFEAVFMAPENELQWARNALQECCAQALERAPELADLWPALTGRWPALPGQPQHAWEPPRLMRERPAEKAFGRSVWAQKISALGDAWVPSCAVVAWHILARRMFLPPEAK